MIETKKLFTTIIKMIDTIEVISEIKKFAKRYKEAIIYFHKDLDGVTTALAVKSLLNEYGIVTIGSCNIQYGAEQYSVKKVPKGILGVLVDFASGNSQYHIQFDHHQEQRGNSNTFTIAESKSCNVEIVNELLQNSDKFSCDEIDIIRIVDSADYLRNGISIENIVPFNHINTGNEVYDKGLYLNKIILAYKSKYIQVNGKMINFLEFLVNNSNCDLDSILRNVELAQSYKSKFFNWKLKKWQFENLPSINEVVDNRNRFIDHLSTNPYVNLKNNNVLVVEKSSPMVDTGSYDRYGVFYNNMNADYLVNTFEFGFVQISKNPFKKMDREILDLSKISRETLNKFKPIFSKIFVSLYDIKLQNESNISKLIKKVDYTENEMIGFDFDEILSFDYNIYYKNSDGETIKFDTNNTEAVALLRKAYNKYYKYIPLTDKIYLSGLKVSLWELITSYSGGHKYITNIAALNYVDFRSDLSNNQSIKSLIEKYEIDTHIDYPTMQLSQKLALCISREAFNILNDKIYKQINNEEVIYEGIEHVIFGSNATVEDSSSKDEKTA
jgi:hypothetical protein